MNVDDKVVDFEMARLGELSAQLTLVQTQTTDSQAKLALRNNMTEVMTSPLINGMKAEIAKLEGKVQEASQIMGAGPPAAAAHAGRAGHAAQPPGRETRRHHQLDQHHLRGGQEPCQRTLRRRAAQSAR